MLDFILEQNLHKNMVKLAVVKTIVTSDLGIQVANKHSVKVFSTLTGFKYIGEKINQFEQAKENCDSKGDYDFLFGYEESYGFLYGTHARDKDAVSTSCLLVCDMVAMYKARVITLIERLEELYNEYGYYLDSSESFRCDGKNGMEYMQSVMHKLRTTDNIFNGVVECIDYSVPQQFGYKNENLPSADVL